MFSCSIFKNVERNVLKVDSTATQQSNVVDKTITTTTEKVDTTVKIKKDSVKSSISADRFVVTPNQTKLIDTLIKSISGNVDLGIKYNQKTKTYDFTAISKPQAVNVDINKTTTTQNNISTNNKAKTTVDNKTIDKTSKTIFTPTSMIIGAAVLIFVIALIVFLWVKFGSKII